MLGDFRSEMRFTQPIQSCNTPRWSQVNENFAFAAAGTSAAARENLNEVVAVKNDENQNQALNEIKQKVRFSIIKNISI